jgi:hypothetical protein
VVMVVLYKTNAGLLAQELGHKYVRSLKRKAHMHKQKAPHISAAFQVAHYGTKTPNTHGVRPSGPAVQAMTQGAYSICKGPLDCPGPTHLASGLLLIARGPLSSDSTSACSQGRGFRASAAATPAPPPAALPAPPSTAIASGPLPLPLLPWPPAAASSSSAAGSRSDRRVPAGARG